MLNSHPHKYIPRKIELALPAGINLLANQTPTFDDNGNYCGYITYLGLKQGFKCADGTVFKYATDAVKHQIYQCSIKINR